MKFSTQAAGAAVFVLSLLGGTSAFAQTAVSDATVAFLMPDQGSTRYEEHD
ncbi:ABC transporter substrate-binding protein, partial [Rhizobium leguminosarum]|nr:ABC transporter substrate-binding protein [Rhizobium leguminosarum]